MRHDDFKIVHVGLPVFDDTRIVAGYEPGIVMGPAHAADGFVVGLENGFKIEGEAVPEGEFAGGGSRYESTAFGCPLEKRN